ncbi:MAG: AAA family ATPase [bacterium]|nr:AAA family ATPase [bacterium]
MNLKSLEISGFKSFAKKSELQFTSAITGIVGPNGSGKSNVAEAFRFVLGEQSIKSLRGKRGEDLIWNGSGDLTRGNRASVKVIFDNSSKIFPMDFNEISIERIVHRDSSNDYFINGTNVRLKDIAELLANAHIGASGHHIISQGEADRILSANTSDRREMIEDALGLKIYQYKKRESEKKLEKTEENIAQVESLRREIAPHLRFLKKQVEKIEKARELRETLRSSAKEYFTREKIYLDAEKAKISKAFEAPKKEFEDLSRDLENAKNIVSLSNKNDEKSQVLISIDNKIQQILSEKENVMREAGRIDGEISSLERYIKREEEKQKTDEGKTVLFKDVEKFIKSIEVDLGEVDREFSVISSASLLNFNSSFEKIKTFFIKIKETCTSFVSFNTVPHDTSSIEEARKEISALFDKKSTFGSELNNIKEKEVAIKNEYKNIQIEIEKEKDTNRDAERDVFRIVAKQNEVRAILDKLRSEEERLRREEMIFNQDVQDVYIIVGREAVDYESGKILNSEGILVNHEVILNESRDKQELRKKEIERVKIRLEEAGGAGGSEIEKEFKDTTDRDEFLAKELVDLEKSSESLKNLIKELASRLDMEFREGVLKINLEFQKLFEMMFGGGSAFLVLIKEKKRTRVDDSLKLGEDGGINIDMDKEEDEGKEGIDISVSLPRKKIKGLVMLSGGERALTSIALLFAISQVNPPPFIILDETDAALDEANSKKYGDMVARLAEKSQLILITHNRETMSRAGVIYGVTMGKEGASKLLSIRFEEAVEVAK